MGRGGVPAVESGMAEIGDRRSAALAARYADAFPAGYRAGAGPDEAALDILQLHSLAGRHSRAARLYRHHEDGESRLRMKLYSRDPLILSDAVPTLENFGFRVNEELDPARSAEQPAAPQSPQRP